MISPFARVVSTCGGTEKLSLWIRDALVFVALASFFRDGVVAKFESNSTPRSFNTGEADIRLDYTLIWSLFELDRSS